jgi:hypothetical protein
MVYHSEKTRACYVPRFTRFMYTVRGYSQERNPAYNEDGDSMLFLRSVGVTTQNNNIDKLTDMVFIFMYFERELENGLLTICSLQVYWLNFCMQMSCSLRPSRFWSPSYYLKSTGYEAPRFEIFSLVQFLPLSCVQIFSAAVLRHRQPVFFI